MKKLTLLIALFAITVGVIAVAQVPPVESFIGWDSGYPKVSSGNLEVSGTLTVGAAASAPSKVTVFYWKDGGQPSSSTVSVTGTAWSGSISGISSGTYYIFVDAVMSATETVRTGFDTFTIP